MSKLDDLIRASHRRELPVTPPERGWDRLQRDLLAGNGPAERRRRPFVVWFCWGVALLGTAAVIGLFFRSPTPEYTAQRASVEQNDPLQRSSSSTDSDVLRANNLPQQLPVSVDQTPPQVRSVAELPTIAYLELTVPQEATLPAYPHRFPPATSIVSSSIPAVNSNERQIDELPVPLPPAPAAPPQRKEKWRFERVPKDEQPAVRWEVGATAIALPGFQEYSLQSYRETPELAGQPATLRLAPGLPDTLYATGTPYTTQNDMAYDVRNYAVSVARQFPKGLVISGGIVYRAEGRKHDLAATEVYGAPFTSQTHVVAQTLSARAVCIDAMAGYTFLRRRRFQVGVGLGVTGAVYNKTTQTQYAYPITERPASYTLSESSDNVFNDIQPYVTLRLQYRLSRRLTLALDNWGYGVRYWW